MRVKMKMMQVIYKDINVPMREGSKLRGCFANQNREDAILHQHTGEKTVSYTYPRVQYKIVKNHPHVVAILEGIQSVYPIVMNQKMMTIGAVTYSAEVFDINLMETSIGDCNNMRRYEFITPWLGLNQENYKHYESLNEEEKPFLLNKILKGNILSLAKGVGITVENQLEVVSALKTCKVYFKNKPMIGFIGYFEVNYEMPSFLGIGKSVSRGFGTIRATRNKEV